MPAKKQLRKCARCDVWIAEKRPVFLVALKSGAIVGPFHAGCASRLVDRPRRNKEMPNIPGATHYGTWPTASEETLPE